MSFKIGNKKIGDGEPCFITLEAGPTHSGLENALELVDIAAKSGADAIKFQILDADRLIADKEMPFTFCVLVDRESGETEERSEPLYDILKRRMLTFDEWRKVKARADEKGLTFFATVGFEDEIEFVKDIGCHSIKIASADVNHHRLICHAARTGLVIQLDTGNSTIGEIEKAVDICLAEGNDKIIIHQCPSGYPARLESINLRVIQTLKQMFGLPVAYSDHTPGWDMDVAAVALGANLVEKTITLDRMIPQVEHIMSLEPLEVSNFIKVIRDVEMAMGSSRRIMTKDEREKRKSGRRSCFYKTDLPSGHMLTLGDIDYRRPGFGIEVDRVHEILGKKLKHDVGASSIVSNDHLI